MPPVATFENWQTETIVAFVVKQKRDRYVEQPWAIRWEQSSAASPVALLILRMRMIASFRSEKRE